MTPDNKFLNRISDTDEYITPVGKYPKFFPGIRFFPKLINIVVSSSRLAKKGIYDSVHWYDSSIDVVRSLEESGIIMHFTGMDNMRKVQGPVIYVGNHMGTMETMILPAIIRPVMKVVYIIKAELATYPFFGSVAVARDPILVGRDNPREDLIKVLEEGNKRIQAGKSIIVFPQKTRSDLLDPDTFNTLGIKLAKRNNVPVIPIALLTDAWGNGRYIKEAGKIDPSKEVHLAFGKPIYIKGNGNEEHQKIIEFITGKLKEWGREDLVKKTKD
jgi:1-acyl-sn-glycerol-3-phosphate acyltransferase